MNMLEHEASARSEGHLVIAGVDEAGRGPLAGPVVAAAVAFSEELFIEGLTDSKKLSAKLRDKFYQIIIERADTYAVSVIEPDIIDQINILQATRKAMLEAVEKLNTTPDYVLIDGNQTIDWKGPQRAIVKGDSLSLSIAAASVLAKVTRDRIMQEYARSYPLYGFESHKGYGSKAHRDAIAEHGPCPIHRKTFRGVSEHLPKAQIVEIDQDTDNQLNLI
jgi:ribonuclease HII